MIRRAGAVATAFVLSLVAGALGYAFIGTIWNTDRVVMHLQLGDPDGTLIDGSSSWNDSAESALALWNEVIRDTRFFVVRDSTATIGHGDDVNNVYFDDNVYGTGFGGAVAITTEWRSGGFRIEGDVVFNTEYAWNSYRGSLRRAAGGGTLYDLRRVAIHEFGHVLGLDHPDEFGQSVAAIMNSSVSNIDDLRPDDIAGAQELYGKRAEKLTAEITKPGQRSVSTDRARLTLRGTANSSRVEAVYLRNHRFGDRYFRASGVAQWRHVARLKPGLNRITLYVDTGTALKKMDRVSVTRR